MTEQPSRPLVQACPELIELAAWCDGRLAVDAAAALEVHLARCGECRALLLGIRDEETDRTAIEDPRHVEASIARAIAIFGVLDEEGFDRGTGGVAPGLSFGSPVRHRRLVYAGRVAVAAAAGVALAVVGYRVGAAVGPWVRQGERTLVSTVGGSTPKASTTATELPFMLVDAGSSSPTVLDLYLALDAQDAQEESRP